MPIDPMVRAPQRIAVIGGGISGLASAWLLGRDHKVTLYEAEPRLGGHARTVMAGPRSDIAVDTGFIVFNYANYPYLTSLFRDLDVAVQRSDMSFGVSLGGGQLEYALQSGNALFGQRRNLASFSFYRMVRDILRFNAKAEAASTTRPDLTIADLLDDLSLGAAFRDHYLFPICGAIWSTPVSGIGSFPAQALIRFMRNHALLSAGSQHQWWTVSGGSRCYVQKLESALRRIGVAVRAGTSVASVTRGREGVTIRSASCEPETYDQVVIAAHADQALAMLGDAAPEERAALASVRFQANRAVLHSDPSVMPQRRRCWSSWIYRSDRLPEPEAEGAPAVNVTYWMNRLQSIPESDLLFVSLNPEIAIPDEAIFDETSFHHPVFDHAALAAQADIAEMQGRRRTWFAGAWLRNGFHEDGFASAMRIARQLGARRMDESV
ncbi:MAG: FAD-dependent oxidoreductase [Xanthobacteraceae bacterium]